MRYLFVAIIVMTLSLASCGKPTAPESPDPEAYGKTITPDWHVPEKDQEKSEFKPLEEE